MRAKSPRFPFALRGHVEKDYGIISRGGYRVSRTTHIDAWVLAGHAAWWSWRRESAGALNGVKKASRWPPKGVRLASPRSSVNNRMVSLSQLSRVKEDPIPSSSADSVLIPYNRPSDPLVIPRILSSDVHLSPSAVSPGRFLLVNKYGG